MGDGPKQPAVSDPATTRTLAAGSEAYRYGMEWNGGDQYNVVGYIGKGAFAIVYKLAMKRDGELFAVKQIEKRRFVKNGILDRKINNEIHIMKNLSHVSYQPQMSDISLMPVTEAKYCQVRWPS